jgi:hypothetical protein
MPPTAVRIIDEKEIKPAPHNMGMRLPTVEPTPANNQIMPFESIPQV